MMHGELYRKRKAEFLAATEECRSITEIAGRFGVSLKTVIYAGCRLSVDLPKSGWAPRPELEARQAKRLAKIIAMREQGEGYREIGDAFGITRERVRQIIKAAGRKDLTGYEIFWKTHGTQPRPCEECGGPFIPTNKGTRFCSRKCMNPSRRGIRPKTVNLAKYALKRRREGATWQVIGSERGLSFAAGMRALQKYGKETGVDVSAAFPGTGHYPRGNGKAKS